MGHAVANRGDREHADFAAFLWDLLLAVRPGAVRARAQLGGELSKKLTPSAFLDLLEGLSAAAGGAAITLGLQVRGFERFALHAVDVHAPESVQGRGFRSLVYLPAKLL